MKQVLRLGIPSSLSPVPCSGYVTALEIPPNRPIIWTFVGATKDWITRFDIAQFDVSKGKQVRRPLC